MKLYWRVKINGKWTFRPVIFLDHEKDTIREMIDQHIIMKPEGNDIDETEVS